MKKAILVLFFGVIVLFSVNTCVDAQTASTLNSVVSKQQTNVSLIDVIKALQELVVRLNDKISALDKRIALIERRSLLNQNVQSDKNLDGRINNIEKVIANGYDAKKIDVVYFNPVLLRNSMSGGNYDVQIATKLSNGSIINNRAFEICFKNLKIVNNSTFIDSRNCGNFSPDENGIIKFETHLSVNSNWQWCGSQEILGSMTITDGARLYSFEICKEKYETGIRCN